MKLLVTAGPTREAIDPVRYISNRSSGKMGYAVAAAAVARGHAVRLISGPVSLGPPEGAHAVQVITAAEMLRAVEENLSWCDVLVMCAAVADWRPVRPQPEKIKKNSRSLAIEFEPTRDILGAVASRKGPRLFVGFAAETSALVEHAAVKLAAKNLDYIVANDVSRSDAGFEVDANAAWVLGSDGSRTEWPLMTKQAMAGKIMDLVEKAAYG